MGRLISVLAALSLLFCLTGCGRAVNRAVSFMRRQIRDFRETEAKANTFEHYTGFRDWYRFPLRKPYHFLMTDILTRGRLEKYNGGDIREPMQSSRPIGGCSDIVRLCWNDEMVVFDRAGGQYGILTFADGVCHLFPTEEARAAFLKAHDPAQEPGLEMHTPEYYYSRFEKKPLK